jgi:hypothetical protein
MILGIVGIVFAILYAILGIVIGIIGLPLSIQGRGKAVALGTSTAMATSGIWMNSIAIVGGIVNILLYIAIFE